MEKYKPFSKEKGKLRKIWDMLTQLVTITDSLSKQITDINITLDTLKRKKQNFDNTLDIKQKYLIELDETGNIAVDENNNLKISPLYNIDSSKTSVVWDKDAKVWRFYAVYAPETTP